MPAYPEVPAFATYLAAADHVDIKTVDSAVSLREFLAGMMSYQPAWVTFLYHIRRVFVRLLGMRQSGIPRPPTLSAATFPMTPGQPAAFFTVREAAEDAYWLADVRDRHLDAALAVIAAALPDGRCRFYVLTIVRYNNRAGPFYFNIIRPFHHLVVGSMTRAGSKGQRA